MLFRLYFSEVFVMTRDFLKELGLDKEVIDKIISQYGADINSVKSELSTAQAKLEEQGKRLEQFKDYNEIKPYKEKFETLSAKYDKDISLLKLDNVLTAKLYKSRAINPDLIKKSIDLSSITTDDKGEFIGLDEQIDALKQSDAYLFASDEKPLPTASQVGLNGNNEPVKPVDPVTAAFYKRNPDLKK